jgi:hypothetical protein
LDPLEVYYNKDHSKVVDMDNMVVGMNYDKEDNMEVDKDI